MRLPGAWGESESRAEVEEGRIYLADLLLKYSGGNSKILFNINSVIHPIVTCSYLSAIVLRSVELFVQKIDIRLHIERGLSDPLLVPFLLCLIS